MTPKNVARSILLALTLALCAAAAATAQADDSKPGGHRPQPQDVAVAINAVAQLHARLADLVAERYSAAQVYEMKDAPADATRVARSLLRDRRQAGERLRRAAELLERAKAWQLKRPDEALHAVKLAARELEKLKARLEAGTLPEPEVQP